MAKMIVEIKGKFYAKNGVLYEGGRYKFPDNWAKSDFPSTTKFLTGPFADGDAVEEADDAVEPVAVDPEAEVEPVAPDDEDDDETTPAVAPTPSII